jgi:hypothetical protein
MGGGLLWIARLPGPANAAAAAYHNNKYLPYQSNLEAVEMDIDFFAA